MSIGNIVSSTGAAIVALVEVVRLFPAIERTRIKRLKRLKLSTDYLSELTGRSTEIRDARQCTRQEIRHHINNLQCPRYDFPLFIVWFIFNIFLESAGSLLVREHIIPLAILWGLAFIDAFVSVIVVVDYARYGLAMIRWARQ